METKNIADYEGHRLEKQLDEIADGAEWEDEIWINPDGEILRIESSLVELFNRQNPDKSGWVRVLFGNQTDEPSTEFF